MFQVLNNKQLSPKSYIIIYVQDNVGTFFNVSMFIFRLFENVFMFSIHCTRVNMTSVRKPKHR